jgi:hypothetical protein
MRRRLLVLLIVAIAAIGLLPLLIAKTPLRNSILSAAIPGDDLLVTVGEASLSWFSTPSLSRLEVKDSAGNLLLTAERIRIDRAPWKLIADQQDLGLIEVVRPTIHLSLRPDGSNIEDAARDLIAGFATDGSNEPGNSGASQPVAFAVGVVEGIVLADELATSRKWRIDRINLQYDSRGTGNGAARGSLSAEIFQLANGGAATPAGRIAASLEAGDGVRQKLSWQTDRISLAIAEPWLRRAIVAAELSGTLSGQGAATWTIAESTLPVDLSTTGLLAIDALDVSAAALNGDRLRLQRVELPWQVVTGAAGLAIEDLRLRSDIGQLAVRGTLDWAARSRASSLRDAVLDATAQHNAELRGSIDLARLAAILPHALRIRSDTTITTGLVELAAACKPAGSGQAIAATINANQLAATSAGRQLRWDQPVNARFAMSRQNGAVRLDSLECNSEFLKISATGTPQEFSADAKFDLNRLAQQLGQFVDLTNKQLAGTGSARVTWKQNNANAFSAQAVGSLSQLRVELGDGAVWAEPQLDVDATATGTLDRAQRRPNRIDAARLQLVAQGDELNAQLTSPVDLMSETPTWPMSLRATGRIARWLRRARPWYSADPWQIDGEMELAASVRLANNAFEFSDTRLVATGFQAARPEWNIIEPRVELAGDARWNGSTGEISANSAQFVTSTVALAVKNLQYRGRQAGGLSDIGQLSGVAAFRADMARLAAWRTGNDQPPEYRPQGALTGNVRFAQQDGRVTGELTASGQGLALLQKSEVSRATAGHDYQTIWQEPQISFGGLATYDSALDQLDVSSLQIQSNTLRAAANAKVERVSTAADANLTGTIDYDLAQITPLLQPYLGKGIQLTGREQARFALAGQLAEPSNVGVQPVGFSAQSAIRNPGYPPGAEIPWSRRVRAQLELPWAGANLYGLPMGAGRLAAVLGDGAVRIEPLSLAIGEGRLTASPQLRLDPKPSELLLPAGPLITNVRISPEVGEAMLKYVAPVLAGATQSDGMFSLELEGTRVPLGEARRADSAGKLTVHSVRVVPGAMVREWIGLARQIESIARRRDSAAQGTNSQITLLAVRDQQVNFRVLDGRVHHQNMEFQIGDVTMRSQGSVGFDETISLTLQVPIQDAWIGDQPLLAGLKGQMLQVPITGTLTRPQMDQRAIAGLSQQLLQGAAQQAIGGELNKALDKLFKSR